MYYASIVLLVIGVLGAVDSLYFHAHTAKLALRDDARREAQLHVIRGGLYVVQFLVLPNIALYGAWVWALLPLFALDIGFAALDIYEESRTRVARGSLPAGEYCMHIALSVLVGVFLCLVAQQAISWHAQPSAVAWTDAVPTWIRASTATIAAGCALFSTLEAFALWASRSPAPPLHIAIALHATVQEVWDITQDHRIHPTWDYRFSEIEMHGAGSIQTGTTMTYTRRILGLLICGWGRYKLHKPQLQSTFEFGSASPLSLIEDGAGLWRYRELPGGWMEFATSFTYRVRWGTLGFVIDRLLFRPAFQWLTEQSFRRLAQLYFAGRASAVRGRRGHKPLRFASSAVPVLDSAGSPQLAQGA
jgi:hypothetical protein